MPAYAATPAVTTPADTIPTIFTYIAEPGTKSVFLAGTFNNWNKEATPMQRDPDGKTWRVTVPLTYGVHYYKFVVNGETWVTDPKANSENDGNGNINSQCIVYPPDYTRPARPDDGELAVSALQHQQKAPFLNYDRGQLTLSLRLRPNDARLVTAVLTDGHREQRYPLHLITHDALYARYVTQVPWDRKHDLVYRFDITDGSRVFHYDTIGLDNTAAKPFRLSAQGFKPFVVPDWVQHSVLYQIFPDRYDDGDKRNDPSDVQPWDGKPSYSNRFGGDAAGVRRHLDYLQSLGISAVYFNPLFASPSNHRYDAQDYKKIDPQFGTNEEFIALSRDMQKRGIRTVMDFAFNHTSPTFFAFQDIRDKGKASAYTNWYFIHSYPVRVQEHPNYTAWFGYPSMPKLNVLNPTTHDYLLSVVDYWKQRLPLAGLRLDAANEVDPRFWRDLRKHAKAIDPNLWIIGEVWGDGSPWLSGDQWDAVMDYPFREACISYFADGKTSPTQFMDRLMAIYGSYAPQVSRNLMNPLSTDDTPRFLTLCNGNGDLDRLAATMQFAWVGMPSIYYGEEIGMQGGKDPDNRRGMEWKKATPDNPMLRYYKRLIAIRKSSPALQAGDPQVLKADDATNTLTFSRILGNDVALVAINRSSEKRTITIPVPAIAQGQHFVEALSGRHIVPVEGALQVTLPALQGAILLPTRGKASGL